MDTIYRGNLASPRGRALAWLDSMLVDAGFLRLVWTNWGVVVPGRLYRSNHPPPGRVTWFIRRFGIRSIINLRGTTGNGSDALSRERAGQLGLTFIDMPMSSGSAPKRETLLGLMDALATAPAPAVVHCKSGADRSGFAAAVFLLMQGASVKQAMRQMSLRFGHMRRSRAGVLDVVLLAYQRHGEGRKSFADWVRDDYDAAAITGAFKANRVAALLADGLLRRE